jgi:transposase-like protein
MNDTQTEPKTRKKRYEPNFKRSAVEMWLSGGKSAGALAAELGTSGQTLKTWKQQLALHMPPARRKRWNTSKRRTAGCGGNWLARCAGATF